MGMGLLVWRIVKGIRREDGEDEGRVGIDHLMAKECTGWGPIMGNVQITRNRFGWGSRGRALRG